MNSYLKTEVAMLRFFYLQLIPIPLTSIHQFNSVFGERIHQIYLF
jgi:hypothetical protein